MKKDRLTYSFLALREKLHRSALGFLKNDEDAKDALQDTFLNLWKAGKIETDSEARNKLFSVLRNICIDRLRRPSTTAIPEKENDSVMVEYELGEDLEKIEQLLSGGLTELQLKIYRLVVHEGLEYEKIADRLGMTTETVRMNMSRARKKIRENYKKIYR